MKLISHREETIYSTTHYQHCYHMTTTCILCYEEPVVIGLLPCNHRPVCHICSIKMCTGSLCACPVCKVSSGVILFTNHFQDNYDTLAESPGLTSEKTEGGVLFMYTDQMVQEIVGRQNKFVCYFARCFLTFGSLNGLKKHLNLQHKRQFCDLCLTHRKCLLSQQRLYTDPEIGLHHGQGEIKSSGTASIYHPFCQFCRQRFYDEQAFLRHMKNHEQCHICNKFSCNKYIYYRDFASLESHYEKSHLVCKHGNCEDSKMMQVFENEEMREFHYAERHLGQNFSNKAKKRIECIKLTGFNLVEHNEKPKDNIGVCVEEQLVSVSNRIELKVVDHRDDPIDVREFYQKKWQFTKAMSLGIIAERLMSFGTREEEGLTMEKVDFFKPLAMKPLGRKEISDFFEKLYNYQSSNTLKKVFFESIGDFKNFEHFSEELDSILCSNGQDLDFFYVFPQLVRYFKDQNPRKRIMDAYYLRRLRKLPCSIQNLIILSKTYSKFVSTFIRDLESCVYKRIKKKQINLALYLALLKKENSESQDHDCFYVNKQKMMNLFHMVEKVPTNELLKLNWLLKVGMTVATHEYVTKRVYFGSPNQIEEAIDVLHNSDVALLFAYFRILEFCFEGSNKFKFEKSKTDNHILRELLTTFDVKMPPQSKIKEYTDKDNQKEGKIENLTTKRAINSEKFPELPQPAKSVETSKPAETKGREKPNELLGFSKPRAYMKAWDEEESVKKSVRKRMTEEEELEFALQQSRNTYQEEIQRTQDIRAAQERANNKIGRVAEMLKEAPRSIEEEEFPELTPSRAPDNRSELEKTPSGADNKKKNKNKKWEEFDPRSTRKEWDQTARHKPPPPPPTSALSEEDDFPALGNDRSQEDPWYNKILPSKQIKVVEVKHRKKKGRVVVQETVDIFNR